MASRTNSAEKPQSYKGMIERREMAGEAEKSGKSLKGAQRAQLRGGSCKSVAEPRAERAESDCTEQLRDPLGSLGVQVKIRRAEGCRKPNPEPKKPESKS